MRARGERFLGWLAQDAVLLMYLGTPAYAKLSWPREELDGTDPRKGGGSVATAAAEARVAW